MTPDDRARLLALVERWLDPEFWKDEGCRMDSQDCAKELAAMLPPVGQDGGCALVFSKVPPEGDEP